MHFQATTPDWPATLLKLPDDSSVKSLLDPSLLRTAKLAFAAAGRDPSRLRTIFRHPDVHVPDRLLSYEDSKQWWRHQFAKFIDATYRDHYLPYVDAVEEANEYIDTAMARGVKVADMQRVFMSLQGLTAVWEDELLGKVMPEECRLIIGNVAVGNDIPKSYYEWAVAHRFILGVHPYTHWHRKYALVNGDPDNWRDPGDWQYHAGRWWFNELEYKHQPEYAFTECGPYDSVEAGWRHPVVCEGDRAKLVRAMRLFWADCRETAAYRQGRLWGGPGNWFTSGHVGWVFYQHEAEELDRLAVESQSFFPAPPAEEVPPEEVVMVTNQTVFNEVAKLGNEEGVVGGLVGQMPYDLVTVMHPARQAPYSGPSPLLWGLTEGQKQTLHNRLLALAAPPLLHELPADLQAGDEAVDLSWHQPDFTQGQLDAMALAIAYSIHKIGEGWAWRDPEFLVNFRRVRRRKAPYFFFRPDLRYPERQAEWLLRLLDEAGGWGDGPVWIDVEEPYNGGVKVAGSVYQQTIQGDLYLLFTRLEKEGVPLGIYSRNSYIDWMLPSSDWLSEFVPWLAQYPFAPPTTFRPTVHRFWKNQTGRKFLWQYAAPIMLWSPVTPGLGIKTDRNRVLQVL